jgi:hypothetical protein
MGEMLLSDLTDDPNIGSAPDNANATIMDKKIRTLNLLQLLNIESLQSNLEFGDVF